MTKLLNLQFTRLDIRPHIKLSVSLVIAYSGPLCIWEHVAQWIGCCTRSKDLGFDSHCWTWKCRANFSFHTASAYPAVMGTCVNDNWRMVNGISCCMGLHFSLYNNVFCKIWNVHQEEHVQIQKVKTVELNKVLSLCISTFQLYIYFH